MVETVDINKEIESLVEVNKEEIRKLKETKLSKLLVDFLKPIIEKYIEDEESLTIPLVGWGRYEKYELRGEDHYKMVYTWKDDTFLKMVRRYEMDDESNEFLERLDKAIADGELDFNLYVPHKLLIELYGGDELGTNCLVVCYEKYFEYDEVEGEEELSEREVVECYVTDYDVSGWE